MIDRARVQEQLARAPLGGALGFLLLFVALPIGLMVVQSCWGPDGFTLAAYRAVLDDGHNFDRLLMTGLLGLVATAIGLLLGGGHAWLSFHTDLPLARWLLPLGIAPLVVPPIFVAMGFTDIAYANGFMPCAMLLGVAHAPFVAVLAARGLRNVDGRGYEAALLARGPLRASLLLLRSILPELLAGCLLAMLFTVADHGVPEFLSVKGKTWHTYAEGVYGRWSRRAVGESFADVQSPIAAAVPFLILLGVLLAAALRLRGQPTHRGDFRPLPRRRLGAWRWPALLLPLTYLGLGIALPVIVLARWALGSAQRLEPMSLAFLHKSFLKAIDQGVPDLVHSLLLAAGTAVVVVLLALPLARAAGRRRPWLDLACALPAAVPAILLGIGLIRAFNGEAAVWLGDWTGHFYDSWAFALCGYAARFLPFAALALSAQVRRIPVQADEAALLSGRSRLARALHIHLPPLLPAAWSALVLTWVLALRELDLAVVLPAANATAVRRLANAVHFQHEDWCGVIGLCMLTAAVLVPLLPAFVLGKRLVPLS